MHKFLALAVALSFSCSDGIIERATFADHADDLAETFCTWYEICNETELGNRYNRCVRENSNVICNALEDRGLHCSLVPNAYELELIEQCNSGLKYRQCDHGLSAHCKELLGYE